MNSTKFEIKEMSKKEALLTNIINEIHEVKGHMCNSRSFEGGFALGELQRSLYNILEKELNSSKTKETREWDENEEEEEEEVNYERSELEGEIKFLKEANENVEEELKELKEENERIFKKLYKFEFVIEYLLKMDHIHPSSIEFCIDELSKVSKSKDYYYNQLRKHCNTETNGPITSKMP